MARRALTEIAQEAWEPFLTSGSWAIDATAGNGHDTEFLARKVGPEGHVFAFDIQECALRATARRLEQAGLLDRVTLIRANHAGLRTHLPCNLRARIRLVCFNLGYLPSGDHSLTTSVESTLPALHEALLLLAPEGCLSVIAYRGHPGGMQEAHAIAPFLNAPPAPWQCRCHTATGSAENPGPEWWLVGRRPKV